MGNKFKKNNMLYVNFTKYVQKSLDELDKKIEKILEESKLPKKVRTKVEELFDTSSDIRNSMENTFLSCNVKDGSEVIDYSFFETELKNDILKIIPKNIEFVINVDKKSPKLFLNKKLLKDAILNIVQNSIDAIEDSGKIEILVEESKNKKSNGKRYLKISIKDNGIGFSSEKMSEIFHPYNSTKDGNTGIGLYNTFNILRYYNGWIVPELIQGEGAIFTMFIPIFEEEENEKKIIPHMEKEIKLLLIEDEIELITFISRVLLRYGYKISMAKSIEEAKKVIKENNCDFDLIFADITLQDGNGLELSKELSKKYPDTKFVITSGFIDVAEINSELKKHGFGFIEKPYKVNELTHKILEVLDR